MTPLTLRSRHTRSPFENRIIRYMYQDSTLPHPSTEGEGLRYFRICVCPKRGILLELVAGASLLPASSPLRGTLSQDNSVLLANAYCCFTVKALYQ